jgi:hypothetical protein
MIVRKFSLFCCFILLFSTAAATLARAETMDEYKERMKKEQEEKKKKSRHSDDDNGSWDLSGFCGCLASIFDLFANTDVEIIVEDDTDTTPPDDNTPPDDATPPDDTTPPDDGTQNPDTTQPDEQNPPDDSGGQKAAAEEDPFRSRPTAPLVAAALSGSYLFGQEISFFDGTARLSANLGIFHANMFYQYMFDETGSHLGTFSANLGFTFPFSPVVISIYAGILFQNFSTAAISFGTDLKFSFTDSLYPELSCLLAFNDTQYYIISSLSLNLVIGHMTLGAGFNAYDYNDLILFGPTLQVGLWL